MKIFFMFLALACLISGLAASSFDLPLNDQEDRFKFKNLFAFQNDEDVNGKIILYPTKTTYYPYPTTRFTTTTEPTTTTTKPTTTTTEPTTTTTEPTTTTTEPTTTTTKPTTTTTEPTTTTTQPSTTTSTTTSQPTTSTTTKRSTNTTPSSSTEIPKPSTPKVKPPQIFRNVIDVQGPFASRLINIVQNVKGKQNTKQKNEILYDFHFSKDLKRILDENKEQ